MTATQGSAQGPFACTSKRLAVADTAAKALVDGFDFTRGAERMLAYIDAGRLPNDAAMIQTTIRLLRNANRHLAVSVEYGEVS